jgi:hypothetical protein
MNARDDIKLLLLKNHITMTEMAKRMSEHLGRKMSRSVFSQKLTNGTLRYDELTAICQILGYELEYKKII